MEKSEIDHAIDAELLLENQALIDGVEVRTVTAHPRLLAMAEPDVERLMQRFRSRRMPRATASSSVDLDDDDYIYRLDSDRAQTMREGPSRRQASRASRPTKDAVGRGRGLTPILLTNLRRSAGSAYAADVATVLLLARAVEQSDLSIADITRVLRGSRPVVAVAASVAGFEAAFLHLLNRGLLLPGSAALESGYDPSGGRNVRFKSARSERWQITVFAGSKHTADEPERVERAVDRAALIDSPILGVAESSEHLPPRLKCAAQLQLVTGPLDPRLVRDVILDVLGEAPEDVLPDSACERLTISDLAIAIRPGVTPARAVAILERIAAARLGDADTNEGMTGSVATLNRGSSDKRGWRSGRGDPGSGSEIIHPESVTGTDGDHFLPRVETLSGYGDASQWALALKADLDLWSAGDLPWEDMSAKLLLSGPPGTGKTTFARALCNSLQVPLIATSVATWMEPGYFGDVLKRMKAAFAEAEALKPSILFIDELDGIGTRRQRGEWVEYTNGVINRALELLDGAARSTGVIVVAATNHPEMIDPALLRSGRLEKHIAIPPPDTDALVGILRHHLRHDLAAVVATAPLQDGSPPSTPEIATPATGGMR